MLDVTEIQNIIPHRYPFLLVDRVESIEKHKSIVAYKNISINEEIFLGHFPGHPIYPGVMIIEGMAQAGGILAFKSASEKEQEKAKDQVVYFMSIDKAKFRAPVKPGDKLVYKLDVIKQRGNIWVLEASAYVDDNIVAQAELKAMVVDK